MDYRIIKAKSYKFILLILALVSFVTTFYFTTSTNESIKEIYNYDNVTVDRYFNTGKELDVNKVFEDSVTGSYILSPTLSAEQNFNTTVGRTVFFKLYTVDSYVDIDNLNINILNKKGEIVSTTTLQYLDEHSVIVNVNQAVSGDNLKLKITNNGNNPIKFICYSNGDGGSVLNGQKITLSLLMAFDGYTNTINLYFLFFLTALLVLSVSVLLFDLLNKLLIRKERKANFFDFVLETIIAAIAASFLLLNLSEYSRNYSLNTLYFYGFVVICIILFILILKLMRMNTQRIEVIYLSIFLPLAMFFAIFVLPDMVNDEATHFGKAVLTSTFNFTNSTKVDLPIDYKRHGVMTYYELTNAISAGSDYAKTYAINQAAPYNPIGYIFSALGIIVARLGGLSIYVGYLLGRFNNIIATGAITYYAIKKMPIGKVLLMLYLLNPMMINQAMSVSADALTNALTILAIAYFAYVKYSDEPITNKDVFILGSCFIGIFLLKMVYIAVYLLFFTLGKKLKTLKLSHVAIMLGSVAGAFGIYYGYNILAASKGSGLSQNANYLVDNNVNAPMQQKMVMANPMRAVDVVVNTTVNSWYDYLLGFLGNKLARGEYYMNVPIVFSATYLLTLILATLGIKEELRFKIIDKLNFVLINVIIYAGVVMALYFAWSPLGAATASGVQGRYFLPSIILILLCFASNKRIRIPYFKFVLLTATMIVNLATLICVLQTFS